MGDDAQALGTAWARAVQAAGFEPVPRTALHAALVERAGALLDAASGAGAPDAGTAAGRWLVESHFTHPATLEQTLTVLGPALTRVDPDRGGAVVSALAAGYAA